MTSPLRFDGQVRNSSICTGMHAAHSLRQQLMSMQSSKWRVYQHATGRLDEGSQSCNSSHRKRLVLSLSSRNNGTSVMGVSAMLWKRTLSRPTRNTKSKSRAVCAAQGGICFHNGIKFIITNITKSYKPGLPGFSMSLRKLSERYREARRNASNIVRLYSDLESEVWRIGEVVDILYITDGLTTIYDV